MAPSLTGTSPPSPANDTSPEVIGSAESGTIVRIYADSACSSLVGLGTEANLAGPGITVSVPGDTTTTLYAIANDGVADSPCSSGLAYTEDSTAPSLGTGPVTATGEIGGPGGSPGASRCPVGSVLTGVRTFTASYFRRITALCRVLTETNVGSTVIEASGAAVEGPELGTFPGPGTDEQASCPAGQVATGFEGRSGLLVDGMKLLCRPLAGPGTPTDPESETDYVGGPGGSAQPAQRCPAGTAAVGLVGRAGAGIDGLALQCGQIEAGTLVVWSVSPASPASDNFPRVMGTAPPQTMVRIYRTSDCTGPAQASGSAADFASPGLIVPVPSGSTTTFHATASDAAGNTTACSPSSVSYTHVSPEPEGEGGVLGRQASSELPPPQPKKTVNVETVAGTVTVKCPGGPKVELSAAAQIPLGCKIDATGGRVELTSARNSKGKTQTAHFFAGAFVVNQVTEKGGLVTVLRLSGPAPGGCSTRARGAARKRSARLWSNGSGRFRTRGRYGAGTVRGTIWLTEERCEGTFTKVKRGSVAVRDFTLQKTVVVTAGHGYLARKPARRR